MICGSLGEIYDCITSWPGSTHDSRIWKESLISKKLRSIPEQYHVLADSAYPISIHLIPPVKNPLDRRYGRFKNVADSANCITAAVVLHNICLNHLDEIDQEDNVDFS